MRKYGKKASKVEKAMHEMKRGKLKSGRSPILRGTPGPVRMDATARRATPPIGLPVAWRSIES